MSLQEAAVAVVMGKAHGIYWALLWPRYGAWCSP